LTIQRYNGFLLTRNWRDAADGVELEFWFATDRGPLCAVMRGTSSVFFLRQEVVAEAKNIIGADSSVEIRALEMRDFSMKPVVGVYSKSHRRSRQLADRLLDAGLEPLEADVNPADRFLMERFVTGSAELRGSPLQTEGCIRLENPSLRGSSYSPRLKVVSFDIETAMKGVQLYSVAVHSVFEGSIEKRVFMLGPGAEQEYVDTCNSEDQLLQVFLDWVAAYDPDVLIGWNVVGFDCSYLQKVADKLERRLVLGRDRGPVRWRNLDKDGERQTIQCSGRVFLDGIDLLRAAFYRFESFSLDNVAQELLGEGKLLHGSDRGGEITRLFDEDKTRLAAYNLRDCELVSEIFDHTDMLEFAVVRSVMTGLNIDRMGGSVASFDNLYLPRLHRAGYVAPNASRNHTASPGGFVLDSMPGIYDHVLVLDFKSLYPSIIRTFGIDPLGLALGVSGDIAEEESVPGFLEARFAREGHILPGLIEQLWQRRDEAKAAGDAALSTAIKIIMNSFYGVLGSPGCRFFDARLASSITRRGHQILQRTRDYIEQAGHRVIYGDTDSVFVWIHEAKDDEQAQRAGRQLQQDLNAWWRQQIAREFNLTSELELEFETHYKRFLMPTVRGSDKGSKKRYAGVVASDDGDKLVFKGLESVRTDWTRLARDFQEELYRLIFMDEPYEGYVRRIYSEILAGQHDSDLVYRKRLRKNLHEYERNVPPHVKAARLFEERGLPAPRKGRPVDYVITTAGAEPAAKRLAALDYDHYVESQLQPVADGILAFMGTSYRWLVGKQIDLF
jgi:DNA polymerase-2